jgi:SAM-dependent methyltransferase
MNGDPPERFPPSQDYYVPPYWADCLDRWPRPPADSVKRTTPRLARPAWAGQQDLHAHWFFFGYSNIWNIDDILVSTLGRSIRETGRILDWGCGCGRVTQHLARLPGCQAFGADIDAANALWARDNIPGAAFEVIGLDPPMPYPGRFLRSDCRPFGLHAPLRDIAVRMAPGIASGPEAWRHSGRVSRR